MVLRRGEHAGIATVTLDRAEKRNALSQKLLRELNDAYRELRESADVRVILTTAAGPSFSAGMDLTELGGLVELWETNQIPWSDGGLLVDAIREVRQHPAVTIASVQGYCAGGGLALVAAHDLAIAGESTRFILPETQRGSFGALAAAAIHYRLPRKIAFDMQLSGRELTGSEAASYGLVSRVVPDDQLEAATHQLAQDVASREFAPLTHAKMAAYTSEGMTFEQALMNDLLVGARQNRTASSFDDVDTFLRSRRRSQGGG
ncbi:enoyl-CoA hydratase/isomerase family protein [Blastococcus sp. CT_GayMR20]|uniref:enoyl-CoA hydratase/isomerase family protein n=1 Tax=Blastococcus sp. CT_GayMR20 TaxID=2559609 RepID=UPI0014322695|nr:enoyl-CoA hydratase/isomerase family protein [Blastococcus sp. CT_GayMR20]